MMIHKDKCLEIGLPLPASYDNQLTYVLKVISTGHKLNTRTARYIGIHNLHSIAPRLHNKGYRFSLEHGRVKCPFTGKTPSNPVDILSMTPEQIIIYNNKKAAKKLK
jgi:hypothetical protein